MKTSKMDKETINTMVRSLAKVAAGYLLHRGYITSELNDELIGALVALVSVGWGIYDARQAKTAKDIVSQTSVIAK